LANQIWAPIFYDCGLHVKHVYVCTCFFFHFRFHADRLAIEKKSLRDCFQKWATNKSKSTYFFKELKVLYPTIYKVIEWVNENFGDDPPSAIKAFYKCLYSPSPVCSYFRHEDLDLSLKLFQPNCKSDAALMKQFQVKIPLFFNILTSLRVETSLSEFYWKGILLYLSEKSEVPFNKAEEVNTGNCTEPNGLCRYRYFTAFGLKTFDAKLGFSIKFYPYLHRIFNTLHIFAIVSCFSAFQIFQLCETEGLIYRTSKAWNTITVAKITMVIPIWHQEYLQSIVHMVIFFIFTINILNKLY